MDAWVDLTAAVAGWGMTVYLSAGAYRAWRGQPHNSGSSGVIRAWLFTICLTLYFTFRVETVVNTVDAALPWNNGARLLAYISVSWAAYFLNQVLARLIDAQLPRWQTWLPRAVTALLIVLFMIGLAQSPSGEGGPPTTAFDFLLREVLYVYMVGLLLLSVPSHLRLLRAEKVVLNRIRLLFSMTAVGTAASLAGVKAMVGVVAFVAPSAGVLPVLDGLASLLKALLVLAFVLKFLPSRYYRLLLRPVLHVQDLLVLRDLRMVERQVHRFCTPVAPESPSLWQLIRSPDYYLHRSLIHILDGHKNLNGYLSPPENLPQAVPTQDSPLNAYSFEEVVGFYELLSSVTTDAPYQELLRNYQKLGRQLRKQGKVHAVRA